MKKKKKLEFEMKENLSREFSKSEEILFCDKFVIAFAKVDERDVE